MTYRKAMYHNLEKEDTNLTHPDDGPSELQYLHVTYYYIINIQLSFT